MLTNIVCSNLTELPVIFYHQDKAKTEGQMFQWPPGENTYISIMYKYKYKYKYKYTFCVTREQRRKDNCEELPDESVGGQVDPSDG